jgi:coenzyme F420-reducing hydrogenase beta subunit
MIAYDKKEDCSGCTACQNICPHDAISMQADREGFLYPVINEEHCNDCGLCQKICPFQNNYKISGNFKQPLVYAAKHRSDEVRMNSSSGGMFTAISDYILSNAGVIYGAAFDKQFKVCHQRAENKGERNKFRGSKYVQSDLNGVFTEIKNELKNGRMVLFTGTPCQNAGLHAFLNKSYENLYLCDIVCHGTPSPLLWQEYIHFLEKKNKSRLISYSFRHKGIGWRGYNVYAVFDNGKNKLNTTEVLTYTRIFGSDLALRSSCYNCKFCNFHRPSDITIADFWGIEKSMPEFDDNKGISLVLVNSTKGQGLFQQVSNGLYYRESNTKDCLQPNLHSPSQVSLLREQFWQEYSDKGFEYVLKRYAAYGTIAQTKKTIVKVLNAMGLLPIVKTIFKR